ncbi:rod shape-determining protein MreD [Allosphingosinicella flava]|uniref:Rod shape-determining protein MreD n=1 Tax=Allosphingosinicella flava TaxID=2771430 RepID=A0A7T2GKB1_9SPHN|nr:rod shape-determining protein MreD [Sphingosinicella flava]QPQ55438.1 rod shape-determining protein MreD [Sphingosinicella flava]
MSWIASSNRDVARRDARRRYVPLVSTIAAILFAILPIVVTTPIVPDFAFLVLIAWRLLRPEMWTAQMALPLGLLNDLVDGLPLGQSMALWTLTFLAFDILDARLNWRDYWMDWFFAALAILTYSLAGWAIGRLMGNMASFTVLLPQIVLSVFLYPVVARIILMLDRWRLAR